MTTTGERLVSISTLISDTALNHFLNIETSGGGPVQSGVICTLYPYEVAYIGESSRAIQYVQDSGFYMSYVPDSGIGLSYQNPSQYTIAYIPDDIQNIDYDKCQ